MPNGEVYILNGGVVLSAIWCKGLGAPTRIAERHSAKKSGARALPPYLSLDALSLPRINNDNNNKLDRSAVLYHTVTASLVFYGAMRHDVTWAFK